MDMERALIAGVLLGFAAPLVGLPLVTRKYSFIAETLGHVSLAGIAAGMLFGIPMLPSALVASLAAAFGVEWLRMRRRIAGDAALAIILSGGLALSAVLLIETHELEDLLFGSLETVTSFNAWAAAALAVIVLLTAAAFGRSLFTVSFDEELARASGLPVTALNLLLVSLAAVTVTVALPLVGALLVGALMVIPPVAAMQWKVSFKKTAVLAVSFSLLSVLAGLAASARFGVPSGGAIVLGCIAIFVFSASFGRR